MSPLRTRLAALTCTAAVVLASGPVTGSAHAEAPAPSRIGLDRLLASDADSARGIATFSAVPTAAEVRALRDLGLVVQPMQRLPLALVQGPVVRADGGRRQRDRPTTSTPTRSWSYHDTASVQRRLLLDRRGRAAACPGLHRQGRHRRRRRLRLRRRPTPTSPTTSSTTSR